MGISKTIPWRKDGILEGSIQDTGSTGDVSFKVNGSSSEKITVNYGDGTSETKSLNNGSFSHTYPANSGPFRITVSGALFSINTIEALPGFKLKGLRHTPNCVNLGSANAKYRWEGDIDNLKFTPDLEKLDFISEASGTFGDISVFQKMNGKLGKNGANFRFFKGSNYTGDVNNFTFCHPDVTNIRMPIAKITGNINDILTSTNLPNLQNIDLRSNNLSGFVGDGNTAVQQNSITSFLINTNNLDINTALFTNSAFSNVKEIAATNNSSYTGGSSFMSNTTSLKTLNMPINVDVSDLANCEASITSVEVGSLSGSLTVFGNNPFGNLQILSAGLITVTDDVANLDLPAIQTIVIEGGSADGTVTFTQSQSLVEVRLGNNGITDIDTANNNYKLSSLTFFDLSDNSIPQTPISDWWIYNDDSTLNVPGSNETYVMDSSGTNMGTLTSAAQTAANNIAAKGWTTSFNS